jgi:hypothetical protein
LLSEKATLILKDGSVGIRVKRAGMFQLVTFKIKKIRLGAEEFTELHSEKVIELGELKKVAEETGLPVEAQNGRAFPEGKGAKDFVFV